MDGKEKSVFEKIISGVDRDTAPENVKKTMRTISSTEYQPKCVLKPLPDCVLLQRGERR